MGSCLELNKAKLAIPLRFAQTDQPCCVSLRSQTCRQHIEVGAVLITHQTVVARRDTLETTHFLSTGKSIQDTHLRLSRIGKTPGAHRGLHLLAGLTCSSSFVCNRHADVMTRNVTPFVTHMLRHCTIAGQQLYAAAIDNPNLLIRVVLKQAQGSKSHLHD